MFRFFIGRFVRYSPAKLGTASLLTALFSMALAGNVAHATHAVGYCDGSGAIRAGCTGATSYARVSPNLFNSPGESQIVNSHTTRNHLTSNASDSLQWRTWYVAGAHAAATPGVLKVNGEVAGRFLSDPSDLAHPQPRNANMAVLANGWFYDGIVVSVPGVPFNTPGTITGSLLLRGNFDAFTQNFNGPANGLPADMLRGAFHFEFGASKFGTTGPNLTYAPNSEGGVYITQQFGNTSGDRLQYFTVSSPTGGPTAGVGNPFLQPVDFTVKFNSGVPLYFSGLAQVDLSLNMYAPMPGVPGALYVQPNGAIAQLNGNFGNSIYWNGLSNAQVNGQSVGFSVSSLSGTDWSKSLAPVPVPAAAWLFASGLLGLVGVARRKQHQRR